MADGQAYISPFPAPPPFYQHFTGENLARWRQLRNEASSNGAILDAAILPPGLRYLVPPEPPVEDKYSSFGVEIDLTAPDPTLADAGIEQLYPSHPSVRLNPQSHLIALARSLLTTFLSLTGILSQNPELYQETAQDLQTIVYNMHDLVNQYRPHQARESLILMMEERVEKMRGEIQAIDDGKEKLSNLLRDLQQPRLPHHDKIEDPTLHEVVASSTGSAVSVDLQRASWDALDRELG